MYRPTIILLKSVAVRKLKSQFLLDRLGRCLKLFVSTESTYSHELGSQFGLAFFYSRKKHQKSIAKTGSRASVCSMNKRATRRKEGGNAGHGRSIASDNMSGDNSDHSGEILSQNDEKHHVKSATTRVYTFTT